VENQKGEISKLTNLAIKNKNNNS